jgi:hypothetical protein
MKGKSIAILLVLFHTAPKGAIFYPHFYHPGKVVGEIVKPKKDPKRKPVQVEWEKELLTK